MHNAHHRHIILLYIIIYYMPMMPTYLLPTLRYYGSYWSLLFYRNHILSGSHIRSALSEYETINCPMLLDAYCRWSLRIGTLSALMLNILCSVYLCMSWNLLNVQELHVFGIFCADWCLFWGCFVRNLRITAPYCNELLSWNNYRAF